MSGWVLNTPLGFATIVFFLKNLPKRNVHAEFLDFLHAFECMCNWIVLTSSYSSRFLLRSGSFAEIRPCTHCLCNSVLFFDNTGALKIHENNLIITKIVKQIKFVGVWGKLETKNFL